jgi:diguanylate cyclase (GGDEF)-like protein
MTADPLSADKPAQLLRVRPAVEAALRNPTRRLSTELQALADLHSAENRLWAIRAWLVALAGIDGIMLRGDVLSGAAAYQIGFLMRIEINLPLAVVLFVVLARVPDAARARLFGGFNLVLLTTICIQSHYALPAYALHHQISAGMMIAAYNLLVPDTLFRAFRFTAAALLVYVVVMFAPIGPHQNATLDMLALAFAAALITLRARYSLQIAARETFLLRLQDSMNTQDVMFANRMLVDLSNTDPLTRMANRRCFDDRIASVFQPGGAAVQPVGLLMIDVDFFKSYNDFYGHPAGDMCLRNVAQMMNRQLRGGQDILARYGGEEFAVLLPGLTLPETQRIGERLCQTIRALALPHTGRPDACDHVTVSIGAVCAAPASSAEALVRRADMALYEAKRHGRDQVYTTADLASDETLPPHSASVTALSHSASLADDLRSALLGGHMCLHYQPIYDTSSGRIAAVEALLRWTHPQRGSISPASFIPAAEESGMIVAIGKWVLRQACMEAASWAAPHIVTVNISPVQFSDPGTFATIATILTETGLPPQRLVLEITEGLQLVLSDCVRDALAGLRALGVGLALDDFGTGYANLSRLRTLHFDVIKIDRSFLEDLGDGIDMKELLTPLVAFARAFGPTIVMEGIETAEQLALVKALGCDWVQGFYLSQPVPAETLRCMIRNARSPFTETMLLTH